tara:strand:- start:3747 stop:5216 length:1470 start_codon:yes stop_codon:yes gene_type:complete
VSNGIIYSCGGSSFYLKEAIKSAESVRSCTPNVGITLFHDYSNDILKANDLSVFDHVIPIEFPDDLPQHFKTNMKNFLGKLCSFLKTPYTKTLFLDTDTKVLKNLNEEFKILDNFDIAIAPGPMTQPPVDDNDVIKEIPRCFPELNTGVIFYKNNVKMMTFLSNWLSVFLNNKKNLYRQHGKGGEQVSLRYLLYNDKDIRMHILSSPGLPNIYNYRWPDLNKDFNFSNLIKIQHNKQVHNSNKEISKSIQTTSSSKMTNHKNIETDKVLDAYIEKSDSNFFVLQIGANDGKMADPVFKYVKLYKWKGLFVEPVTYLFDRLIENYRGCEGLRFENSVIAKHSGEIDFFQFPREFEDNKEFPYWASGMGSVLKPFDSPGHKNIKSKNFNMIKQKTPCLTFTDLLSKYNIDSIDLLQIDAEGYDGELICSINFDQIKPKFIRYEDRHVQRVYEQKLTSVSSSDVTNYLAKNGYVNGKVSNGFDRVSISSELL